MIDASFRLVGSLSRGAAGPSLPRLMGPRGELSNLRHQSRSRVSVGCVPIARYMARNVPAPCHVSSFRENYGRRADTVLTARRPRQGG